MIPQKEHLFTVLVQESRALPCSPSAVNLHIRGIKVFASLCMSSQSSQTLNPVIFLLFHAAQL